MQQLGAGGMPGAVAGKPVFRAVDGRQRRPRAVKLSTAMAQFEGDDRRRVKADELVNRVRRPCFPLSRNR
jgi:hypothetical protein